MPAVSDEAVRRVVQAAAAARLAPADEPARVTPSRCGPIRVWSAVGMAAAAAIVGFVARGAWLSKERCAHREQPSRRQVAVAPDCGRVDSAVGRVEGRRMSSRFRSSSCSRTRARIASRVVGDFNNWNPTAAPMTRSSDGALWSAIVPILPGRHMYGFMVDDSIFVLDPRAQKARDPDLGTEGSVRMVGRP